MLLRASIFFTLLALVKVADSTIDTFICLLKASKEQLDSMTMISYEGSVYQYTEVPIAEVSALMNKIDTSKETVVFIPHYLESLDLGQTADLITAYLALGRYNVLRLHYPVIADSPDYFYAACSVPDIGVYLAWALNILVALGLDPTTLSIVGFSLGGQIVGATGRNTNFTVEKLIGLDPAGPGFYSLMPHLASGDGRYVIIIHADRGVLGIDLETGDVDFYPNNGANSQPGCFYIDICSHLRAADYWIEAVERPGAFLARKCGSWNDFEAGFCDSNEVIEMGLGTPITARGSYFLQTNALSPYGREEAGTTYNAFIV